MITVNKSEAIREENRRLRMEQTIREELTDNGFDLADTTVCSKIFLGLLADEPDPDKRRELIEDRRRAAGERMAERRTRYGVNPGQSGRIQRFREGHDCDLRGWTD